MALPGHIAVGVGADRFGGRHGREAVGSRPVADRALGPQDGLAVDHVAVPEHGLAQGVVIEASRHGAGPGAVRVDEQWLGTGHVTDLLDAGVTPEGT